MREEPTIDIGSGLEIPPGSNLGNIQKDFERLEKNQEKVNTFMMWITGIIAGVFFVTGILIALDYFRYSGERYEKFINEIKDTKIIFNQFDENAKNSQILNCLKIRGYFSKQCFE